MNEQDLDSHLAAIRAHLKSLDESGDKTNISQLESLRSNLEDLAQYSKDIAGRLEPTFSDFVAERLKSQRERPKYLHFFEALSKTKDYPSRLKLFGIEPGQEEALARANEIPIDTFTNALKCLEGGTPPKGWESHRDALEPLFCVFSRWSDFGNIEKNHLTHRMKALRLVGGDATDKKVESAFKKLRDYIKSGHQPNDQYWNQKETLKAVDAESWGLRSWRSFNPISVKDVRYLRKMDMLHRPAASLLANKEWSDNWRLAEKKKGAIRGHESQQT